MSSTVIVAQLIDTTNLKHLPFAMKPGTTNRKSWQKQRQRYHYRFNVAASSTASAAASSSSVAASSASVAASSASLAASLISTSAPTSREQSLLSNAAQPGWTHIAAWVDPTDMEDEDGWVDCF